jgi:KEOPS complex subunit Cgi121
MIRIVGAKGNIQNVDDFLKQVIDFSKKHDIIIQVFDADVIYGKSHLTSAVMHAQRAIEEKRNTTNSLEMEILLYASGERQLKLAIPKMGVKKSQKDVALVLLGDNLSDKKLDEMLKYFSLERDDKVLEGNKDTLKNFGISEKGIATVTEDKYGHLILEKVAMVDIIK